MEVRIFSAISAAAITQQKSIEVKGAMHDISLQHFESCVKSS